LPNCGKITERTITTCMLDPRNNLPTDRTSQSPTPSQGSKVTPFWQKPRTYFSLLALSAIVSCSSGYMAAKNDLAPPAAPATANQDIASSSGLVGAGNSNFITQVVEKVGPAVVRINASKTVANRQMPNEFEDPFFRRFFGDRVPQMPQERDREVEQGTGSGFIINTNGQILTNAHVIAGADKGKVTLKDGRTFNGKVLGADRVTDVAVVQIDAKNLTSVQLGNSESLKPGEWAIAIGNPLGLDNTVTTGIISATGRRSSQIGASDKRVNYIQTDAAINPGNSGGPLLNAAGQAIGMNTAILRNAQGLGFAIPINTAQRIANQLIAKGKVDHPFLGIQMLDITPELRQQINEDPNSNLKLDTDKGVLIARVVRNSPAAKAGIRSGDVIQKVSGQDIADASSVQQMVEKSQIGGSIQVQIRRNGQNLNVNVVPTAAPQGNDERE
jgi:Do/DeqQ family serine protease